MRTLMSLLVSIMLCSSSAFAYNPAGTGWTTKQCKTKLRDRYGLAVFKPCKKPNYNYLGFNLSLGAPEALGVSLVGRPLKFLQLELGGSTTLVGGGVKAGVMVFLPWYLSPSVEIEGGRQWGGNFNNLAVMLGFKNPEISLLNDVQYNWVSFLGGLGFGHPNWFYFRLSAGYSYITANTIGLQDFVRKESKNSNVMVKEAGVNAWIPTAKVALQFYF
jgi:hypothetical protein